MNQRLLLVYLFVFLFFLVSCEQLASDGAVVNNASALFNQNDLLSSSVALISAETNLVAVDLENAALTREVGLAEAEVLDDEGELVSQAVLSGVDGYLGYFREDGSTYQIWIHNQASDVRTLVYGGSFEVQSVAVSGNGLWVAASIKNASGRFDVYLFDVANVAMLNLTNSASKDELDVSISANGLRIVFSKPTNAGLSKINICDYSSLSSSCSISLLPASSDQVQASISGNGQFIALVRKQANGRRKILVYDFMTGAYVTVVSRLEDLSHPSVSNDGSKVMFLRDRTGVNGRYLVRIADLSEQTLRNELSSTFLDHPHLTADAMYFAYEGPASSFKRAFTRNIVTNDRASAAGGNWNYHGSYWQQKPADVQLTVVVHDPLGYSGYGIIHDEDYALIDCPGLCTAVYEVGTEITIYTNSSDPVAFGNWSEGVCPEINASSCTFTITEDTTITHFFSAPVSLSVSVNEPAGSEGIVEDHTGEIYCFPSDGGFSDCNTLYAKGSLVTLNASASNNSFDFWSGGPCEGIQSSSCSFTIDSSTSVTANFSFPEAFTLDIDVLNPNLGKIQDSTQTYIDCGKGATICSAEIPANTDVILQAFPDEGMTVNYWDGVFCSEGNEGETCTFNSSLDTSISVDFVEAALLTVTINEQSGSIGYVRDSFGQINCGPSDGRTDCTEIMDVGEGITLTATAVNGVFLNWSGGDCDGSTNADYCRITFEGDESVTANFAPNEN